jgi:hypothetical protein
MADSLHKLCDSSFPPTTARAAIADYPTTRYALSIIGVVQWSLTEVAVRNSAHLSAIDSRHTFIRNAPAFNELLVPEQNLTFLFREFSDSSKSLLFSYLTM